MWVIFLAINHCETWRILRDDIHKTHTNVSQAVQDFSRVADNFCKGAPHQMECQLQDAVATKCV